MRSSFLFLSLLLVFAAGLAPRLVGQILPPLPALDSRLDHYPEDPDSLPLHLSWQVRPGYLYFVEATDDLTTGDWHCFNFYLIGTAQISIFGDTPVTFRSDLPAARYFLRVRSLESESDGFETSFHRDHDHDGVDSQDELNLGRNPFFKNDADADGLPDDWEYQIVANHYSYDPEPPLEILGADTVLAFSARTALAEWIRAWSVGLRFDFGGKSYQVFNSTITLPGLPAAPAETMSLQGQANDGAALLSFADSTREKVIALRIYPQLWLGAENLPYADLSLEPSADYTWVDDAAAPALSGFVFTGTTVDGVTARDLLRRLETRLPAAYLGLPAGTTVAMPYRRATVPLPGGGSELRRVPAPLALTSLPLTTVSPTALPMTIRTFFSSGGPGHPDWGQLAPTYGILWAEGVQPLLDADGLPAPVYEFVPPPDPFNGRYLYASGDSFRSWYRRSGPQTYTVPARTSSITPPDATRSYRYGFYSLTRAESATAFNFPPHSDTGNSVNSALHNFTGELHLRLDYDTTTHLYFSSSDDGWVFVNGQLISELNLGGRHAVSTDQFVRQLNFSVIRQRLGLPATGSCRVDIFYANRGVYYSNSTLRFLSTSILRPIYVYQAEADALLEGPLTYQLDQAPAGMSIAPATGKITWDLYAPRGTNGLPTVAPGAYPVTVSVTDTHGHSDTQSFTLTVSN